MKKASRTQTDDISDDDEAEVQVDALIFDSEPQLSARVFRNGSTLLFSESAFLINWSVVLRNLHECHRHQVYTVPVKMYYLMQKLK